MKNILGKVKLSKRLFLILIIIFLIVSCKKDIPAKDYCEKDSDCTIKQTGCDCCGYTYACLNINTDEGDCNISDGFVCECIHEKPKSCTCIENKCQPSEPYIG